MQGIIVELPLAPFFLKQLLRRDTNLNDLATLDQEVYRNLMLLKAYKGDVQELALTFTISRNAYGDNQEVRLLRPRSRISEGVEVGGARV